MSLTSELKQIWLAGPLRRLREGDAEANAKIEVDAKEVAKLLESLVKMEEDEDEEKKLEAMVH
jgi:hypothetical protein